MCDFISAMPRELQLASGGREKRDACFAKYAPLGSSGGAHATGRCDFHGWDTGIVLSHSGASLEIEYEDKLVRYISSQRGKYRTLDLSGLRMPFRNGIGIMGILADNEIDLGSHFAEIILDDAVIYAPTSFCGLTRPDFHLSLARIGFYNSITFSDVCCATIDLSDAKFSQHALTFTKLSCRELRLRNIALEEIFIENSTISRIDARDANIQNIRFRSTTLGSVDNSAPHKLSDDALLYSALSNSQATPVSQFSIIGSRINRPIDLRGRSINILFQLSDTDLCAPIRLQRGFCKGDQLISELRTALSSASRPLDELLWERMFSELKRAALAVGDRKHWAEFAKEEQAFRIHQDKNWLHRLLFHTDGILSDHGTSVANTGIWLLLQLWYFTLLYCIVDNLTGRWRTYSDWGDFLARKLMFSISQTVRPFSAFEADFMGHPYSNHIPEKFEWLDAWTLALAGAQGVTCVAIFASALFALRHRVSSLN